MSPCIIDTIRREVHSYVTLTDNHCVYLTDLPRFIPDQRLSLLKPSVVRNYRLGIADSDGAAVLDGGR